MVRRAHQQGPVVEWPPVVQLVPATAALTGALWERLVPLLPPQKPPRGRPTLDHRRMVEGMLWVMRTGAPWRELPVAFGPWQTLYSRYRRWCTTGVWAQIVQVLHTPQDTLPLSA
jgi:transposase